MGMMMMRMMMYADLALALQIVQEVLGL